MNRKDAKNKRIPPKPKLTTDDLFRHADLIWELYFNTGEEEQDFYRYAEMLNRFEKTFE